MAWLGTVKKSALDLFFPKFCLGCAKEGEFLCQNCALNVTFLHPQCFYCGKRNFNGALCSSCAQKTGLRRFLAPFAYSHPLIRNLIHAYKYERIRELHEPLASFLANYLAAYYISLPREALLLPIPLHPARERERGFNQSRLIANILAQKFNLKISGALRRLKPTRPQIEMKTFAARQKNVADAFQVRDSGAVLGRAIILIDDVATSGATLGQAARALRAAGAKTVWAITIAKG